MKTERIKSKSAAYLMTFNENTLSLKAEKKTKAKFESLRIPFILLCILIQHMMQ